MALHAQVKKLLEFVEEWFGQLKVIFVTTNSSNTW
jgi:hypothetical protein